MIVTFRKQSQLPLDDCLFALRIGVPHLSRSALHRCFQRHGVSRLSKQDDPASPTLGAGSFRFGLLSVTLPGRVAYMYLATDRVSQMIYSRGFR